MVLHNGPFIPDELKYRYFPAAKNIENACETIRKEFKASESNLGKCIHENIPGFIISNPNEKHCWRTLILKKQGVFTENIKNFPEMKSVLTDASIQNAMFSILDPRVNIPPHIGYYKGYLRYHLGVEIPDGPFIVCGGQKYYWKNCEGVLFDDMFLHYVENPTSSRRVVLYIDVKRKDIPTVMLPLYELTNAYINTHPVLKKIVNVQHTANKTDE